MTIIELFTSTIFLITFFGGIGITLLLAFLTRRQPINSNSNIPVYDERTSKLSRDVDKLRFNSDMQYIKGLQDGYNHAGNRDRPYVINDNTYHVDDKHSRR